jgi:hypothetical protein
VRDSTRLALRIAGIVAAVYLVLCAGALAIMWQPPERFARAIAKAPGPLFMVLPFETLWGVARGGKISRGDHAPDFDLPTLDHSGRVRLSSFQGREPVILIFGSYT